MNHRHGTILAANGPVAVDAPFPVQGRFPVHGRDSAPHTAQRPRTRVFGAYRWTHWLLVLVMMSGWITAGPVVAAEPKLPDFRDEIAPLLKKHCYRCHGPKEPHGEVDLQQFASAQAVRKDRETWTDVLKLIELEAMPPEDEPQPTKAERSRLVDFIEGSLFFVDCDKPRDPGRVTIRRLNRTEYNNTVRDLLGVDLTPADDFPSDDVGEGFDNIGDVLSLPPLLLEKYMDAAEALATTAIVDMSPDSAAKTTRQGKQLRPSSGVRLGGRGIYTLSSQGDVTGEFTMARGGEYLLRVEAGAQQAGNEPARVELRLDGKKVHVFDVQASPNDPKMFEHRMRVSGGKHRLSGAFINDFYNPRDPNPKNRDRNLYIRSLEVAGPVDSRPEDFPESHRRLVSARPGPGRSVEQAARKVLTPLLQRSFRRPAEQAEIDRYAQLVQLAVKKGDTFERGLQVATAAILVSPHFLFRIEQDPAPQDPKRTHPLNDFELANRLSYFLWSTMPDDRLFRLASTGDLHRDDVLEAEVTRMLNSEKANALVENFGGQWLNLRNLDDVTPDPSRFPQFDAALKQAMRKETELVFAAVMREDRSLLEFLNADFTFVNARLAKHYGLPSVQGDKFQRVSLASVKRRGILTHASILTLTSNPTRTSPVKRGKWILENILGTPPPAPPPGVPELVETQKGAPNASLREQLELHRRDPACAVCHIKMDALGFGLENYDAVGRWRDRDGRLPIDSTGKLPDGTTFRGSDELAEYLVTQDTQFGRALTRKMLTYALGRGLEYYDRCAVDKIMLELPKKDYRFSILVTEIVKSEPFRMRRGEGDEG